MVFNPSKFYANISIKITHRSKIMLKSYKCKLISDVIFKIVNVLLTKRYSFLKQLHFL